MGQKPLDSHPIDRALAQILDEALSASDYSLRALSRASGVRLTRLGDVLRRGKSMTTGEVEQISHALGLVAWEVVQEAERRIDTPTTAGAGHSSAASSPGAVLLRTAAGRLVRARRAPRARPAGPGWGTLGPVRGRIRKDPQ